ncbi:uncharacterized protein LOC120698052 isoform X3 [Panicum virgatum]|nr:uncharacterized protein LOC120698052 isoform X3 [Panicum virgatum]
MATHVAAKKADLEVSMLLRDDLVCSKYLPEHKLSENIVATTSAVDTLAGADFCFHAIPVQQAEENRLCLLHADMQKRAALKERTSRSLVQKATSESKYMEQVRSAILQNCTAAKKKRLRLLEAEKVKAQARLLRIQKAAMNVCSQRETERKKLKEQRDNKLQRIILLGQAKRQRAEYLKQRGSPLNSAHADYVKHAEFLSRKLA